MFYRYLHCVDLFQRRVPLPQPLWQPFRRNASASTTRKGAVHGPSPSQLVRFALTGSTRQLQNESEKDGLDQSLQELFVHEWPLNSPPTPLWSSFRHGKFDSEPRFLLDSLKRDIHSLQDLRLFVERHVNTVNDCASIQIRSCNQLLEIFDRLEHHHSYQELLLTINGINERFERIEAPVSWKLYLLGMRYACRTFSVPALKHHLNGFRSANSQPLDLRSSTALVNTLITTLQSLQSECPDLDTRPMLSLITGEGAHSNLSETETKLHEILSWPNGDREGIELYITLLASLGSEAALHEIWEAFIHSPLTPEKFQPAYSTVLSLFARGRTETALLYLKQLSECANNALPGISNFRPLATFFRDEKLLGSLLELAGPDEFNTILESQLRSLEQRLGIKWDSKVSRHISLSDAKSLATGQPLFTIEGDSSGYESQERLFTEIRLLGCSKSKSELGQIIDMLDEHEGSEIPVRILNDRSLAFEFAWFPRSSPIEFSDSLLPARYDMSRPWSPVTLGLIRARPDDSGSPVSYGNSLHLIQLGYLNMRPILDSVDEAQSKTMYSWKETGHLVAWDRTAGKFLAVFVGKGHGVIEPGLQVTPQQPPAGLYSLEEVEVVDNSGDFWSVSPKSPIKSSSANYHFDLDPATDLLA
ncbi:hypothetical protein ASPZODRAFT_145239 [Penicilliopsis zonata CBS 506.65]|uniref:Uncharacterized protein n=1 Tax=Penicilliopsis zonata CBS 506.65 TaxID=1073090 RepID=A0A1L9SAH5_9EURO|nr:hypothetical protein ASPZODRAFT_145239 [Penicilliopsis zonata CBS 506.65]OJJ44127.1 hypothetical protein ASPZODRAFT_145239 [Penicilliopsis zonata CBS 506.65]